MVIYRCVSFSGGRRRRYNLFNVNRFWPWCPYCKQTHLHSSDQRYLYFEMASTPSTITMDPYTGTC